MRHDLVVVEVAYSESTFDTIDVGVTFFAPTKLIRVWLPILASPALFLACYDVSEAVEAFLLRGILVFLEVFQLTGFVELLDVRQDGPVDVLGPLPTRDGVFVLDFLSDGGQLFWRLELDRRHGKVRASCHCHEWAGQTELVPSQIVIVEVRLMQVGGSPPVEMVSLLLLFLRTRREVSEV